MMAQLAAYGSGLLIQQVFAIPVEEGLRLRSERSWHQVPVGEESTRKAIIASYTPRLDISSEETSI